MIKKIKILFLIVCCCFLKRATAQHWDSLSSGLDFPPYSMYADSVDNYLYVCGQFNYAGGLSTGGIAKWDGSTFSNFTTLAGSSFCRALTRYHDTIYACAGFWSSEQYVAKWNGVSWDSIGNMNGGGVINFFQYNDELYVLGIFDSINHTHASNIAKWNGTVWSSLKDTVFNGAIDAMAVYNGDIYIGGNFNNVSTGMWRIAKWNGTNYVQLAGGGVYGGMDDIVDMVVYDGELYVSGTFTKSSGNVGNYIQKWNGTNWSEVGGGVMGLGGGNGQIHDMKVYNGELYVVGVFETAGGVPAQHIAKWNGVNWCGFGSSFDNTIGSIQFKYGDMYIGGGFWTIDGDSSVYISKWIGGSYIDTCGHISTGINESNLNNESFTIYPNPTSHQITLEFELTETNNTSIEIKNILGQIVKTISNTTFTKGNNKIEIDVSEFTNGIYFVQLQNGNQLINQKFIKQ
jgi:trimeric autotransporter adhesin